MTDEEIAAAAAAEKAAADQAAADKAAADKEAADKAAKEAAENDGGKPSDTEARLIKDLMKHKDAARAAKEAADKANAALKAYEGIDVDQVKQLLADKAEADRKELERKGEYERIVAQMSEQTKSRIAEIEARENETKNKLADAERRINDLTIGQSFSNSKFISDQTVLSGNKARVIYGDHFDIEDGETVAYDKPRGSADRTPLVDATGSRLGFEAAIEKIMRADADFERFAKSNVRSGSNSKQSDVNRQEEKKTSVPEGRGRIAIGLSKLTPNAKR